MWVRIGISTDIFRDFQMFFSYINQGRVAGEANELIMDAIVLAPVGGCCGGDL